MSQTNYAQYHTGSETVEFDWFENGVLIDHYYCTVASGSPPPPPPPPPPPAPPPPSPPTLLGVSQASGRISARWTLPTNELSWGIDVSTQADFSGGPVGGTYEEAFGDQSITAWTSTSSFSAGTYFVRVIGFVPGPSLAYSNTISVLVPKPAPPKKTRKAPVRKVFMCHHGRTIRVPKKQVRKRLRAGDKLGRCRRR